MAFIQSCIDEDQHSPTKKQRHTARRIFTRLVDELGYTGCHLYSNRRFTSL